LLKAIDPNLIKAQVLPQLDLILERNVSSNGNCYLEIVYPRLVGLKDSKIEAKINIQLAKLPESARNFYQQKLERSNHCTKFPRSEWIPSFVQLDQCKIVFAGESIISLECREVYGRGLYPILSSRAITLNLRTGKVYRYSELFRQDVDYIKITRQLIRKNYVLSSFPESIKSELSHLSHENADFYLSSFCNDPLKEIPQQDVCLVIPKQLASGVRQKKTIQIKLSQLNKILSSDPDLQGLLK
jgi:hypothetical protein